jgi:hypothetical protein
MTLVVKTTLSDRVDANLVLDILTEDADHYNDVTRVAGCRLIDDVALFGDLKIGRWLKTWTEGKKLKGKLLLESRDSFKELSHDSSSSRVDEIHTLVKCGAIRGCSVQFKPIRSKQRTGGGTDFIEQELLAVNLVALGCDPAVLVEAKAKGVSTKVIREIFREQNKNASLAERIQAARFAVKLHEQDKPKMTRLYTHREREDVRRRAEETLGYKIPPRTKTISSYVDDQRMTHNKESLAKAKAMISKWKKEKALEQARARAKKIAEKIRREREVAMAEKRVRDRRDFKRFEWGNDKRFVTWKGQKIPKSEWEKD